MNSKKKLNFCSLADLHLWCTSIGIEVDFDVNL